MNKTTTMTTKDLLQKLLAFGEDAIDKHAGDEPGPDLQLIFDKKFMCPDQHYDHRPFSSLEILDHIPA